jgi:hypothetical protein
MTFKNYYNRRGNALRSQQRIDSMNIQTTLIHLDVPIEIVYPDGHSSFIANYILYYESNNRLFQPQMFENK